MSERLGIVGSGAIATGLAAVAAEKGPVTLCARSDGSADRARDKVRAMLEKKGVDDGGLIVTCDRGALAQSSFLVEAIVEDPAAKAELWRSLNGHVADDAVVATTTSSLSVAELASASGRPDRFVALHVFNPVPRMALIELSFPDEASESTRERARALCADLGKTAVEVPDTPGFVVNRLLFPFLFDAVRLQQETGLEPEAIDTCMKLGAGHPLGPLALLDLVGLDVSAAIGRTIGTEIPPRVDELIAEGALGRKSGRGFYDYA